VPGWASLAFLTTSRFTTWIAPFCPVFKNRELTLLLAHWRGKQDIKYDFICTELFVTNSFSSTKLCQESAWIQDFSASNQTGLNHSFFCCWRCPTLCPTQCPTPYLLVLACDRPSLLALCSFCGCTSRRIVYIRVFRGCLTAIIY
jgi:hypothetical protein